MKMYEARVTATVLYEFTFDENEIEEGDSPEEAALEMYYSHTPVDEFDIEAEITVYDE